MCAGTGPETAAAELFARELEHPQSKSREPATAATAWRDRGYGVLIILWGVVYRSGGYASEVPYHFCLAEVEVGYYYLVIAGGCALSAGRDCQLKEWRWFAQHSRASLVCISLGGARRFKLDADVQAIEDT